MTIVDYILEYEENGKKKANIPDYYDIFIKTLDKRFRRYSYKRIMPRIGDRKVCTVQTFVP